MKKRLLKLSLVALAFSVAGACSTTTIDNSKAANTAREKLAAEGIPFSPQALAYFAGEGNTSKVQLFLDASMNINAMGGNADALMVATAYQKVDMVKYLIAHGSDVNKNTYHGTALSIAAGNGNIQIAKILLQNGANPNAVILDGYTPLMTAAFNGKAKIIKLLAQHGAKVDYIHPVTSFTPLTVATYYGKKEAAVALIKAGANVNYIDSNGLSALDWSQIGSFDQITKALVESGAKVEMKKENTVPAVMLAVLAHENIPMIGFLVNKGLSLNGMVDGKMPIVVWCAKCNVPNSALELIKLGADFSVKDPDGQTTLDWAIVNGQKKLAKTISPKIDINKINIPIDPNVQNQATLVGELINDQYYQGAVTSVQSLEKALSGTYSPDTSLIKEELRSDKIFKNPAIKADTAVTHQEWDNNNKEFENFDKQIQLDMQDIDKALSTHPLKTSLPTNTPAPEKVTPTPQKGLKGNSVSAAVTQK